MISHKNSIRLIKIASTLVPFRKLRRDFRQYLNTVMKVDYRKNLQVQNYLKQYTETSTEHPISKRVPPKELPIWQLWFQGSDQAPPIIKKCFESVEEHSSGRDIIILDENSLLAYIDLPDFILRKKKAGIISNTHFSDIVRICLLEKYGGTWIDATVLLTSSPQDKILNSDFFAFYVPEDHPNYEFHAFSSWFMHAQPNQPFIKDIKQTLFNYWKNEARLIDYFCFHFIAYNVIHSNREYLNKWQAQAFLSNKQPHLLQESLDKNFNKDFLDIIKRESSIHKLTYKYRTFKKGSFLDHLVNDY